MADRLKGITIEIGGDTSGLSKALKSVNNDIKKTQSALKDVDKLLKFDPSNTELLSQKQRLLADAVTETRGKLDSLKDAAEKANEALEKGTMTQSEYDALQREIADTEQQLRKAEKAADDFGSVMAQQVKAAGEKVKDLGSKVEELGKGLTTYVTGPLVALGGASIAAFNEVDEGEDTIIKKTGATGEALEEMSTSMKNLATSIPTDFATAGTAIGEVNARFGVTGQELEDLSGKFIKFASLNDTDVSSSIDSVQAAMAAFGVETDSAGDVLDILTKAGQNTGVSVDKLAQDLTSNGAALQEMGFGINSAVGFLSNLNKNGLDSSSVLTGMKKALQAATKEGKPMSQALDELQQNMEGATSDTEAMQMAMELFGSKAGPALALAIQEGRLSFDEMSNSVRDFGDVTDSTFEATLDPADDLKTMFNELKEIGAELGGMLQEVLKPALDEVKEVIGTLKERWEKLTPEQQEQIVKIGLIVAAIGPLLLVVGKVISLIGTIMTLAPMLSGAIAALTGPLGAVIAIVTGVIAIGVLLYKNWDTIKEKAGELWQKIKDTFDKIKDTIKNALESAKNFVKDAIDKIKSFFKFDWELPKIKLPHFSITGKFSLNPPSIPKLSVDWYAKAMDEGMILTSPTIFGNRNGTLLGGGEAGPEAVVGVSSLRGMITDAISQQTAALTSLGGDITIPVMIGGERIDTLVVKASQRANYRSGGR